MQYMIGGRDGQRFGLGFFYFKVVPKNLRCLLKNFIFFYHIMHKFFSTYRIDIDQNDLINSFGKYLRSV